MSPMPAKWRWGTGRAGIMRDELVGPFQVEDGFKIFWILEDRKMSASVKKDFYAPSHASKYLSVY